MRFPRRARGLAPAVLAIVLALAGAGESHASTVPSGFADSLVIGGLDFPVGMAFLPDGRLLVIEQKSAKVRLVIGGSLAPTDPVATLPGVQGAGTEQGLLGIAVDPGWPARPWIYVHLDDLSGHIRISRYTATGDLSFTGNGSLQVDPATRYDLVADIPDLYSNHNGGTLRFGLDGRLYDSVGDDFQYCPAQDTTSLLGKILRLDVSRLPAGPGAAPRALVAPADNPFAAHPDSNARLVWALGLRNPFRFGVDAADGSLFIADVGDTRYEEMDHAVEGGRDFGWPLMEGPYATGSACPGVAGDPPIFYYGDGPTAAAVIGAGAYRRPAGAAAGFPSVYEGDVFLSDYYYGFLLRLKLASATWGLAPPVAGQPTPEHWGEGFDAVSDWLVGPDGALWYCRQAVNYAGGTGQIRRIVNLERTDAGPGPGSTLRFLAPLPNPFSGRVAFRWTLPRPGPVTLLLFDVGGRQVRAFHLAAGSPPEVQWDGTDERGRVVRPGIYLARLEAAGARLERRVARLR